MFHQVEAKELRNEEKQNITQEVKIEFIIQNKPSLFL